MSGPAEDLAGTELERGIELFSRVSHADGARAWTPAEVRPPAPVRLYRATAAEHFVLVAGDRREPVAL